MSNIKEEIYEAALTESQMECDELKAHIERLRSITDSAKHYLADIQHGVERTASAELGLIAELEQAFFSIPPQSLNHIKAQVEEETIELLSSAIEPTYPNAAKLLRNSKRKYKEQSDD